MACLTDPGIEMSDENSSDQTDEEVHETPGNQQTAPSAQPVDLIDFNGISGETLFKDLNEVY
jgi:hypothetical protein